MLVSTDDLQKATDYLDEMVRLIREARGDGIDIDVERLIVLMVTAFGECDVDIFVVLAQQSLMLSIAIQRLAS